MKILLTNLFLVIVLTCCSFGVAAQSFSKIREKAIKIVEARYPESEMSRREMTLKHEENKQAFYNWQITRNEKQRWMVIKIFYGDTNDETAKFMKVSNWNIPVGPGSKRGDLGEEAYYFEDTRTEFARLRFRKANVYIDIQAKSLKEAEEIAREFDKFIKKK